MVRILATWLGTVASVFGFIYTLLPPRSEITSRQAAWLTAIAILFVGVLVLELLEWTRRRPRRYRSREAINRYMQKWISGGDRVVIFTRDMSWAHENEMRQLLTIKAQKQELTICLPEEIQLTNELAAVGARIVPYPHLQCVPSSRFTIINEDRMDARVAIGHQVKGVHVIEEFSAGDHPVFWVAQDLIEIIRKAAT